MESRPTAGIVALVGAALVLAGTLTSFWIAGPKIAQLELGIGLRHIEACVREVCQSQPYTDLLPEGHRTFVHLGRLTWGLGLVTAALLLGSAWRAARGIPIGGPVSIERLAALTSLAGLGFAIAFVASQPAEIAASIRALAENLDGVERTRPWSLIGYLLGCLLGGGAALASTFGGDGVPSTARSPSPTARQAPSPTGRQPSPTGRAPARSSVIPPFEGARPPRPSAPQVWVELDDSAPAPVGSAAAAEPDERPFVPPEPPMPTSRDAIAPWPGVRQAAAVKGVPTTARPTTPKMRAPCPTCGSATYEMPGDARPYCRSCRKYVG
jgi:hypothetical protein